MINLSQIHNQLAGRTAGILTRTKELNAAVILPLIKDKGELRVLFEVRAHHLYRQPGEICFPGGRIDSTDPSPKMAAIRELTEELGVKEEHVHFIAPLDVLVTPFRGVVYPFVAELTDFNPDHINKEEVDHVFSIPLSYLYDYEPETHPMDIQFTPNETFPLQKISNSQSYKERTYSLLEHFYYYNDYVVWGITAQILTHFLELIKNQN